MYKLLFDSCYCCITNDQLFMIIPGKEPKHGYIENNKQQVDIILTNGVDIDKSTFESIIPHQGAANSIFCALYYVAINN